MLKVRQQEFKIERLRLCLFHESYSSFLYLDEQINTYVFISFTSDGISLK